MLKLVSQGPGNISLGRDNFAAGGAYETCRDESTAWGALGVGGVLLHAIGADTSPPLARGPYLSHGLHGRRAKDTGFGVGLLVGFSVVVGGGGVILAVAAVSGALEAVGGAWDCLRRKINRFLLPGFCCLSTGRNREKYIRLLGGSQPRQAFFT